MASGKALYFSADTGRRRLMRPFDARLMPRNTAFVAAAAARCGVLPGVRGEKLMLRVLAAPHSQRRRYDCDDSITTAGAKTAC